MAVYTYFDGEKLPLKKAVDSFIARADPKQLERIGLVLEEQTSSASWRIQSEPAALEGNMTIARQHQIVAHHAYRIKDSHRPFLISDRILVTFEEPPTEGQVSFLINDYALELVETLSGREYVLRLSNDTGINPVKLVVQLSEAGLPNVETVNHDLNMIFRLQNSSATPMPPLPSDPAFRRQWHLHDHVKETDIDYRSSTRCLDAWKLLDSYGERDVVIGITDSGCQLDHRDFNGPSKFADWGYWDGNKLVHSSSIGADPAKMYDAGQNHGTSCAGVAAAEADGVLTVGAAPACRLLPIKWPSNGSILFISVARMVKMLSFIADKVDILSNSWAAAPHSKWPRNVTDRIRELAVSGGRRDKGILFLWAAGNNNCPLQHSGSVDIPYTSGWCPNPNGPPSWCGVLTSTTFSNDLADIPGVMHVAAMASTAKRSHYSNYGRGIDICAPSNNAHTYRRGYVQGRDISTTTGPSSANRLAEVTHGFGGTSSATPLVAGIAALTISANRNLTALQVQKYLTSTASKNLRLTGYPKTLPATYDPDTSWDVSPVTPYDRGSFDAQGWSPWFGFGKVDALKAVGLAKFNVVTTLLTPKIAFQDVPERDLTWRAIIWECIGFSHVTFEVVNGPDAPFFLLLGRQQVTVRPRADEATRARLWLGYTGNRVGDGHESTITIRCQETNEEWTLEISANVIKRPSAAVVLVLDKSMSMGWAPDRDKPVSGKPRRVDLLSEASWNLVNLVPEGTGIAVVCFNHVADLALSLARIVGASSSKVRESVRKVIASVSPAGRTSIGNGVKLALEELSKAQRLGIYDSTSLIILTDGQENSGRTIKQVLNDVGDRDNIFAVGLGEPNVIDPDKLALLTKSALEAGKEGYVLLTGALTLDTHLILTKYYQQILAGIVNWEVALDPEQRLTNSNSEVLIPFNLSSLDHSVDVILLTSRGMTHEVVFLDLISPEGKKITPSELPKGVEYFRKSSSMVYYRFTLPLVEKYQPYRIVGSPGCWNARVYSYSDKIGDDGQLFALSVLVRSEIRMTTSLTQTDAEDGGTRMDIVATLTENGQSLAGRANLVAYIDGPGVRDQLYLVETDAGGELFEGQFSARKSGLYICRIVATGRNSLDEEFTREQLQIGAVYDVDSPPDEGEVRG